MTALYEKARAFMYLNARPLDMARWQYHFECGSKDAVINALSFYQNADGGFGHALEADAWNPNSSPIQTWAATEILREVGFTDGRHPVIRGILRYLDSGRDFDGAGWFNTVKSNNDFPHAPWWHTESESVCHNGYNPTACLAGFIIRFAEADSPLYALGARIAGEAAAYLMAADDLNDMHTISCFISLAQYLDESGKTGLICHESVLKKLRAAVDRVLTRDVSAWQDSYVCRPSQFFRSADSLFYPGNEDIARFECDFIENSQTADGSWNVTWAWADYPEQWALSKNWWKADIVIKNLLYLRGFSRL
jgi:hypothetical protein